MSIPSDEYRRVLDDAWQTARAEKLERRRQNREAWASSPNNSHNRHKNDAIVSSLELEENTAAGGSESLRKLRAIMADTNPQLYRRLDAAEVVLSYELGPAAAVGADPSEIAAGSYHFLKAVADAPETPEALKFRALKSIVTVENARVQVKNTAVEYSAKRELVVKLCNAERGRALRAAGVWRGVIARGDPWSLETTDEFDWPNPQWPGDWTWPPHNNWSAMLEAAGGDAARNEAFRAQLRAIKAKNRPDDCEKLLSE